MKAFAILMIILCLLAAGGMIFMLVTSSLDAVSVSCTLLSADSDNNTPQLYLDLFDKIKSQLEDGSFVGTVFSDEALTSSDQYRIYIWTVHVDNRTVLPARIAEIQVLPMKGYDILQFDMDTLMSDSVPNRIIQPHSSADISVCILTSAAIANASSRPDVRDATISWYFAGYPFPESNGKGGKLILRP